MDKSGNLIYVAKVVEATATDGPGLRNSLYVSGCGLRCPGCHNSHLWPLQSGERREVKDVYAELMRNGLDISILGGEPLMQYGAVYELCRMLRVDNGDGRNVWLYTGYTIDEVNMWFPDILDLVDVVVDGPFIEALKDDSLVFRGSSNQRIWEILHTENNYAFHDITNFYQLNDKVL